MASVGQVRLVHALRRRKQVQTSALLAEIERISGKPKKSPGALTHAEARLLIKWLKAQPDPPEVSA